MKNEIEAALAFTPKPPEEVELHVQVLQKYFNPESLGVENIPVNKPTLFVGNHTRYGFLDMPLIVREIYIKSGVYPRTLSDRAHFKLPIWRDWITSMGGVQGSKEMCRGLMKAGKSIVVYPGGAKEVVKGKGENYQLQWENRLGFVKMASEAGYSITPFASVGADEAYDVLLDSKDIMDSRVGRLFKRLAPDSLAIREDLLIPISRGIGLTGMPRPEKFYFAFGKPIETAGNESKSEDAKYLKSVQKKTAQSIEKLMSEAMLHRARQGGDDALWRKVLNKS